MDHTPFIIAAYGITTVVLLWCALTPIVKLRRIRKQLAVRDHNESGERF